MQKALSFMHKQSSVVEDSVYCFDSFNCDSGAEPKQLRKTTIKAKKKKWYALNWITMFSKE